MIIIYLRYASIKTGIPETHYIFKEEIVMSDNFVEIVNKDKGRKLTVRKSTFNLDEGTYKGTITDAFWYKTVEGRDRIMLVFQLEDGTEFKNSVYDDWIEKYPFSGLISQADISYVEDFKGLRVKFEIRNKEGNEITFSNIRKINLDK